MGKSGGETKEMHIEGSPPQVNINPSLKVDGYKPVLVPAGHRREDTDALGAPVSPNAPWYMELAHQRDPQYRGYAWDGYHMGFRAYEEMCHGKIRSRDEVLFRTCDWVGKLEVKVFFGPAQRACEESITATRRSGRRYVPVSQSRREDIACVLYYICFFLVCV